MPWPAPSPYLTTHEVAAATGFAVSTLAHWRTAGKGLGYGPPYVKNMGRIRYPAQELEAWMREDGLRRTTGEGASATGKVESGTSALSPVAFPLSPSKEAP